VIEAGKIHKDAPAGLPVERVEPGSPAMKAGIEPGDRILSVNGQAVHDMLDLYAASFEEKLEVRLERGGKIADTTLHRRRGEDTGIGLRPEKPALCRNKCIFCFVDQMPPGLRRSLYVKDEDYRHSFLHGNYLTLTNIRPCDEERILRMHLSPLYVSVHAVDAGVRARLLGRSSGPVVDMLNRLGRAGIRFHTQVVLVPGHNDAEVLEETVAALADRHEWVLSLSIVPVGLTRHRAGLPYIRPVDRDIARHAVDLIEGTQARLRRRLDRGLVYAADELFLLAGAPLPGEAYYDDYPQIDNGVGMLRLFLESAHGARMPDRLKGRRLTFVTGVLAGPYLRDIARNLSEQGVPTRVLEVENGLFGPTVTVSGLLAGEDVRQALRSAEGCDLAVLPPNLTNAEGLTLDGLSVRDLETASGMRIVLGDYDFKQTIERIQDAWKN
jgi:putative radical SAM enzyme (TIGR03279 family)